MVFLPLANVVSSPYRLGVGGVPLLLFDESGKLVELSLVLELLLLLLSPVPRPPGLVAPPVAPPGCMPKCEKMR